MGRFVKNALSLYEMRLHNFNMASDDPCQMLCPYNERYDKAR